MIASGACSGVSGHLSDTGREAAVRSLEGATTLPFTCVTSACQCHQGASIFHLGISLPVALRFTSPANAPLPPPPPFHPSRFFNLKAPVTHLSFLSSTPVLLRLLVPGPRRKAGREPSERKCRHQAGLAVIWGEKGRKAEHLAVASGDASAWLGVGGYTVAGGDSAVAAISDISESHCSPLSSDHRAGSLSELTSAERIVAISLACPRSFSGSLRSLVTLPGCKQLVTRDSGMLLNMQERMVHADGILLICSPVTFLPSQISATDLTLKTGARSTPKSYSWLAAKGE
ncbi:unnamed protein product [Pleuronectes platessa]|uniref:Uncharacterized protein n=1 Tax=Pleuronectes platessa TaxID=8262 RepID=A0A9N7UFC1_PLEPL|nr:unnamed protein product [Pleuronectes platessa]